MSRKHGMHGGMKSEQRSDLMPKLWDVTLLLGTQSKLQYGK